MSTAGPIFVSGIQRTGTSLIYALLASHPSIAMTRRTNWWTFFDGRFGDLGDDESLDRCLGMMQRYRRHTKLQPDWTRLREDFRSGERSYCRLFALLEEQHAARVGKPRWGDKSLNTERYAERVFECFPDARILHMIRDPRDRHASVLKRWKSRGGVGSATAAWLASVQLAERNVALHPDRFRVVRYEDLATEPEATLRELCAFIGEPYEPAMLSMSGASDFRDAGGNSSFGRFAVGQISTASIGRYRDVLSDGDIAFMDRHAGAAMARHGYPIARPALGTASMLRYRLANQPLNLAIMGAWHLRERWQELTGRRPSSHTILEDG
jgi:hypothetical protein